MPSQDVALHLFYDGAWRDVTADDDVLTRGPVTIRRGQGEESSAPRPAQVDALLANDDDRYRTSNPTSALYGRAGRNTPAAITVAGNTRAVVEASSWACDQTQDFRQTPRRGSAWTELEGGGLLQRIGQWTQPLRSPFRQYNDTITGAIGYFPGEQARGSTTLVSTIDGTRQQGDFTGAAFDSQYRPAGSGPLMDIEDGAGMGFYFAGPDNPTSTAGWQLSWVARYEPFESGQQTIMYWETGDGTAYGLDIDPDVGDMFMFSSKGGVTVINAVWTYDDYDFTQWTLFSIDASYSAGTTTVWVNWTNEQSTDGGFGVPSFAGVPASLRWWSVLGGAGEIPAGSTMGHVMGFPANSGAGTDLFGSARRYAWTGYLNEPAALRFIRLCNLFNIYYIVSASYLSSTPMGPQPVATLAELLQEIVTTDDAILFDYRTDIQVALIVRQDRYNRAVRTHLVPEDLPALPREVVDDLPIHNFVTAVQREGAEAVAEDSTGPLGTQPPPVGAGLYEQRVDVNLGAPDWQLADVANWWLRRGTVNLPRFPQVVVNLAALPASKVAEIEAVDVGDVITIGDFREDLIRLQVLGYTETIGTRSRKIVFNCAPDLQFDVARWLADGATLTDTTKRYDSRTSTLSAAVAATAGTMVVTFTDPTDAWSTTGAPYDWVLAGERVTVTAMGAMSGSGPYSQTATVRRSVNGVLKAQTAGTPIHMHPDQQARYAL
jgi:hypothetical protein